MKREAQRQKDIATVSNQSNHHDVMEMPEFLEGEMAQLHQRIQSLNQFQMMDTESVSNLNPFLK